MILSLTCVLLSSALFNSLNPSSLAEALAYYELHPEYAPAKERVLQLTRARTEDILPLLSQRVNRIQGLSEPLTLHEIQMIEELGKDLPNRRLKGYFARNEAEVLSLPSEQIDLGKALLLSQVQEGAEFQARSYSALLDLMAMQILATLPSDATAYDKIRETNRYIFETMHFRFPPQSVFAENIDRYTFLPSVMDDHLGVCLGVTALYLSIAQRLDLPLEIITPPGHIYVRYCEGDRTTNIETTARGVDYPSEVYLSVNTCRLQKRVLKEVVGLTHFNEASTHLHTHNYAKAFAAYEKARLYIPDDPLVKELQGYSSLFTGKKELGVQLLKESVDQIPEDVISKLSLAEDYLVGRVNEEGIEAVFSSVDETRESLLAKKESLESILSRFPAFREGWHQLGITWLQLHRNREAIAAFKSYDALDSSNPSVTYYLAVLHGERRDFKQCWAYLRQAEAITSSKGFSPKVLRDLRRVLTMHCPDG